MILMASTTVLQPHLPCYPLPCETHSHFTHSQTFHSPLLARRFLMLSLSLSCCIFALSSSCSFSNQS
jgi:hypothetical protein